MCRSQGTRQPTVYRRPRTPTSVKSSGSWRRKGDRTLGRELDEVIETLSLDGPLDWLALLPGGASRDEPWDSAALGDALGIRPERARKILYTFAKAGLMEPFGKAGRRKLYRVAPWARELHKALGLCGGDA